MKGWDKMEYDSTKKFGKENVPPHGGHRKGGSDRNGVGSNGNGDSLALSRRTAAAPPVDGTGISAHGHGHGVDKTQKPKKWW